MTIDGLNPEHIGQVVVYISKDAKGEIHKKELGVIKSYRNEGRVAFVVYSCANQWIDYANYTGAATSYDDLRLTNMNLKRIS